MKFLKPLGRIKTKKCNSFGQKRAQQMNQALAKARKARKSVLQKEYLSPNPLDQAYKEKGNKLDLRIRNLKDKI